MTAERLTDAEFEAIVESCGDRHEALAKGISIGLSRGLQRAADWCKSQYGSSKERTAMLRGVVTHIESLDREREGEKP